MAKSTTSQTSIESQLNSIENIIEKLEKNECSLDESLKLFEEGTRLIGKCRATLEKTEQKILSLTKNEQNEQ